MTVHGTCFKDPRSLTKHLTSDLIFRRWKACGWLSFSISCASNKLQSNCLACDFACRSHMHAKVADFHDERYELFGSSHHQLVTTRPPTAYSRTTYVSCMLGCFAQKHWFSWLFIHSLAGQADTHTRLDDRIRQTNACPCSSTELTGSKSGGCSNCTACICFILLLLPNS